MKVLKRILLPLLLLLSNTMSIISKKSVLEKVRIVDLLPILSVGILIGVILTILFEELKQKKQ